LSGDITCVWTDNGWLYLAVVIDLFSRQVDWRADDARSCD
jgi:putative transposase